LIEIGGWMDTFIQPPTVFRREKQQKPGMKHAGLLLLKI
jgi:hypothetical protein